MTSDEMNRAMEFILQQEAQLSVRMDELAKQMQELSELHKRDHGLLVQMAVQEQRIVLGESAFGAWAGQAKEHENSSIKAHNVFIVEAAQERTNL